MERILVISYVVILTSVSAIMAAPEPPSNSYGTPSTSYNSFSSSNFNSNNNFNRNQDASSGYQNFRNSLSSSSSSSSGGFRGSDPAQLAANIPGPKVFRHISLFVAPQENEPQQQVRTIRPQSNPDKHVQIIFVKAPSHSNSQQTEVILPEQPEQKTLVYVLLKKAVSGENNVKVRGPAPTKPPAPEVYFIKYKDNGGSSATGGGYSNGGSSFGSNSVGALPARSSSTASFSTSYGAP